MALDNPSIKIENYDDIRTGDMFRIDCGKHVIFIIEKIDDTISYVQSSSKTFTRGVHFGYMKIVDKHKSIKEQVWSDKTSDKQDYNTLIDIESGDGIYRLKYLS